jgi:cholesterol oxidase
MDAPAQPEVHRRNDYEMVIIGSGFGGSILTCRTAKHWPGKVLLLERGKRYPMGSFPRSPRAMANNFWNIPSEDRVRPSHISKKGQLHGLFDIRNGKHINAVLSAGLGGGSLIYANVFLEPPEEVFAEGWPTGWAKHQLAPYYTIAKSVLGSRPIPQGTDPRRTIVRSKLFDEVAASQGRPHRFVDINVFFGNDFDKPTAIGKQECNRYGALQTSCVYCGECDVGCNTHSKNTLDLNYLFAAEHRYKAEIRTEHMATKIVPVDADDNDDNTAQGEHGYRVYFLDLLAGKQRSVLTRRVAVSAGAIGSTELLMQCRDVHGTLPHVSAALGQRFSANGDFLCFAVAGKKPADPTYGPVITRLTDFNLFSKFDRDRAFILEDAAFPAFGAWYVEGAQPPIAAIWKTIKHVFARLLAGASLGRVGFVLADLLKDDASYRSCVLLCMGLDKGSGLMRLNDKGFVEIDWPYRENMKLYDAILSAAKYFGKYIGAKAVFALPTWWWPARHNVTVHALGGCILADNPGSGVTSAAAGTLGQVFGYRGLYVADGSIVPTALGANPTATIAALAEMVAEGITGDKPDDCL